MGRYCSAAVVSSFVLKHPPGPPHIGLTALELWGRVVNDYGSISVEAVSRYLRKLVKSGKIIREYDEEWIFRRNE